MSGISVAWASRPCSSKNAWARCPCYLFLQRIILRKNVSVKLAQLWMRRGIRELYRVIDNRFQIRFRLLDPAVVDDVPLAEALLVNRNRVALASALGFFLRSVLHRIRHRVPAETISVRDEIARAFASSRS